MSSISTEIKNHVLHIGLNRPNKLNAFTVEMLNELAEAFTELEDNPELRCAVFFAHGKHFTAGLDLANVTPHIEAGNHLFPNHLVDPLQVNLKARPRTKPVVIAVQGYCLTIALEFILAADICVAQDNATFGQIEIKRGIFPFGGATIRMQQRVGWGNAMRYLLTGDMFDAKEALRIGFVQEVVSENPVLKATEIAETIAQQAPMGVQSTIVSARQTIREGEEAAKAGLIAEAMRLMASEDAAEGLASFVERRAAVFVGK